MVRFDYCTIGVIEVDGGSTKVRKSIWAVSKLYEFMIKGYIL